IRAASQALFKLQNPSVNLTPSLSKDEQQLQSNLYIYLIMALDKSVVTKRANDVSLRTQEFIDKSPNNAIAWGLKGWKQANELLWKDAVISFEAAIQQPSVPGWVLVNCAVAQENLKNYQAAIEVYNKYINYVHNETLPQGDRNSLLAFAHFRIGTLYGQLALWNEAKLFLDKAIQYVNSYAQAYHNLGWVLLNTKNQYGDVENSREMLSAYTQAIKLYNKSQQQEFASDIKQAFQLIGLSV
ncbi:MAG: serine/threonine protein kinase, partial [Cylindrospermopsis raciborskii PAMP2012]|nr:serine/threonine protein kinase [Cylindrospermopsis raciborskii PAMP2012]